MEIIPANHLSIDEHVARIRECLDRARSAIFDTVAAVKECHEQLGDEVFEKEVAKQLGMHPSTLSRWLAIGTSQFIMDHRDRMPNTFTGLYNVSRLETEYEKFYKKAGATKRLVQLLEKQKISSQSQGSEIQELINGISDLISN